MNDDAFIATWDLLQDFGFKPDGKVISDVIPGLSLDFGGFKLSASCVTNERLVEVVMFGGVLATKNSVAMVNFEMPRRVTSREQCAAWIVWNLDSDAPGKIFIPAHDVAWLNEGRQNQSLLPWVAELEKYGARPMCIVQRNWLKLALNELAEILSMFGDETPVEFSFCDAVLTIRCADKVVALSGQGEPWPEHYRIPAGKLRELPKRLMNDSLEVSIWNGHLTIGHWRYDGVAGTSDIRGTQL